MATIVFRADASHRIGTGHVTRCLTLAEMLLGHGAQVTFVCREHPGHLTALLRARGLDVRGLPAPADPVSPADADYASWLGVSAVTDAAETIAALHGKSPDWLVVDHYGLGALWEQELRSHVGRLLVIDDLADRHHDCDVLLDPNHWCDPDSRHAGLVPVGCQMLVGAQYALLGPEYARYRHAMRERDGLVRRVLVYFGGSDPDDMTGMVLALLLAPQFQDLAVDIVIGPNNTKAALIRAEAASRPHTSVHGPRPHLADLMADADVAIGAGGVAIWERLCLGLPSLVVCTAENQRPTCEALSAAGLIDYVGDWKTIGPADLELALRGLLFDRDRLVALSARGASFVDGCGAGRVADIIISEHEESHP